MPWVSLDDEFHSHPKVIDAGLAGAGLYARALSYCGAYLTNGFVPGEWATAAAGKQRSLPKQLEKSGLWRSVSGGFLIPDYLDFNPDRETVLKRRTERSQAGRRGAKKRWQNQTAESSGSSGDSSSHGSPLPTAIANPSLPPSNSDGKTMARAPAPCATHSPYLPPTEEAIASSSGGAQELVAHFINESCKLGGEPPRRVVGQVAQGVKALLDEGQAESDVRAGLERLAAKGLNPASLSSLVFEGTRGPAGPRKTGWRWVRGTHSSTFVPDPNGTDRPPAGYA